VDKLVIVGTGALARDITGFVTAHNLYEIVGYACSREFVEEAQANWSNQKICVIEDLKKEFDFDEVYFFVAISHFWNLNKLRKDTFNAIKAQGGRFAKLISPLATVLIDTEDIGEGTWIRDYAYIAREVKIGENTFVGIQAFVAHFGSVGSHVCIAPRATILGSVKIGDQCFIGANATLFNDIEIGEKCIIGAATVIKKNVENYCVCKLSSETCIVKQYTEDMIEQKLLSPQIIKKLQSK